MRGFLHAPVWVILLFSFDRLLLEMPNQAVQKVDAFASLGERACAMLKYLSHAVHASLNLRHSLIEYVLFVVFERGEFVFFIARLENIQSMACVVHRFDDVFSVILRQYEAIVAKAVSHLLLGSLDLSEW